MYGGSAFVRLEWKQGRSGCVVDSVVLLLEVELLGEKLEGLARNPF